MPRKVEKVRKPNFLGDESSSLENGTADGSVLTNESRRRSQRNRSSNQQDAPMTSETSQREMSQSQKSTPRKAGANASLNREKSGTSKRKQTSPKKNMTATTSKKNTSKRPIPQGLKILKNIMHMQKETKLLIPKLPFSRVIREVLLEFKNDLRITGEALKALQESSETYLTHLLSDAYKCTMHRRAVTLEVRDVRIVRFLRGLNDPGNH